MTSAKKKCVQKMISKDIKKFKAGKLKSGSGKRVKSIKQTIAIGYSQGNDKCKKNRNKKKKL